MFGLSDFDILNKDNAIIIDGIAGGAKSTITVNKVRELFGEDNFALGSFSNALKFSAEDKFGCIADTICGLCFINNPYPRTAEKSVEYPCVILDELLLDGTDTIDWIEHNIGKVKIIALTDSHQMLSVEDERSLMKKYNHLINRKDVIYININESKRPVDEETNDMFNKLYALKSNKLFNVNSASTLFNCDVLNFDDIDFNMNNAYIFHSNEAERTAYKAFNLSEYNPSYTYVPKQHIARKKDYDASKYPIAPQKTAEEKRLTSYQQLANCASPTRFQGKEVDPSGQCYFIVNEDSIFTGRELYTVGTRCKCIKSLHIVILKNQVYADPETIKGIKVCTARHLDIPDHDKTYHYANGNTMNKIIEEYGQKDVAYSTQYITSGNNLIYSQLSVSDLQKMCEMPCIDRNGKRISEYDYDGMTLERTRRINTRRSIRSIVKKDVTMYFDFMPMVYTILNGDVTPPRINNPKNCKKADFNHVCDLRSAFPTILHHEPMPKAGYLYTEYDPDKLNFYRYKGDKVTKGSIITEDLYNLIGEADYVFSTDKQYGCELGHYTYNQSRLSVEKKARINQNFLWGTLEKGYYKKELVSINGKLEFRYIKHSNDNLELVACALWSALCLVMLNAIKSLNLHNYVVATDGLYYNGNKYPTIPEWCDYRIERKDIETDIHEEKYANIEFKTYDDLKTEKELDRERHRANNMTDEQKKRKVEMQRLRRQKQREERLEMQGMTFDECLKQVAV